ncbi:MAG: transglycosylase domain-containing protein [Alphaproteobacteria bacterium]|nr:transglycosylase domain-containing protein [Alphaproteobacteria bacterium]
MWLLTALLVAASVAVLLVRPHWVEVRDETVAMADAHLAHEVSHPGWSFPATVWSAPAPLDLPAERLVMHAKARGYEAACPAVAPGQVCEKDGVVVPRGGRFPEGLQPPGTDGWTRPLALEPVRIGALIGPDAEIRTHLPIEDAPTHLLAAIIAAEDEEFFEHPGVDFRGLARAAWINAQGGSYKQGASTITMQVVRNLSQDKEKALTRKLREAAAAMALDAHLGKEGVLQVYLDAPYLGQDGSFSICGFHAAAFHYYGVHPRDLTLSQAATLAGILPAPGRFAPDRFPDKAKERRDMVLDRMEAAGWDVAAARAEPVTATPHARPEDRWPSYLQATRVWAEQAIEPQVLFGAGLDLWTALDVVAQQQGDALLAERVPYMEKQVGRRGDGPLQAAGAVVDSRTGYLVAVHGGEQALSTDFNRATQARRQPGSALKPLVYALALSRRGPDGKPAITAAHAVRNHRAPFPDTDGWNPRNVGGGYTNTATLAYGLAWSQNIATAALLQESGGPEALIELAGKLGFDTRAWPAELGLALGQGEATPLEMARFVATVIGEGHLASAWPVIAVTDARGRARLRTKGWGEEVLPADAAALTRELMRGVIRQGTGGASRGGAGFPGFTGNAIGKTGTTDSEKDLWFVGGSPDYTGALWLGYDQPVRIGASASDLAAPLWGWWMRAVHQGLPKDTEFESAVPIESTAICRETGGYGNGSCPLIGAPFLPGTKPSHRCTVQHVAGEKKEYESLWDRKEREKLEAEGAGAE